MKADGGGWIRYWITASTAAGLLNGRQALHGQRICPGAGELLYGWIVKLGLDDGTQLKWVMADVAGIAPSMGSGFGPAGAWLSV